MYRAAYGFAVDWFAGVIELCDEAGFSGNQCQEH
jgi:hypothetical protein